jgi:DnaJ-class molecular chaperone|tara:strand:- start:3947 stop:4270 length:324 start_codon:yes stop_codon:yes gene_type:complete
MKTKKKTIWDNDYNANRYGTGEPGSPSDWREVYEKVMGEDEANEVLSQTKLEPHQILGVSRDASLDAIKQAYRYIAKECKAAFGVNPDLQAETKFKEANAAYSLMIT